jgi:hypothetical protein
MLVVATRDLGMEVGSYKVPRVSRDAGVGDWLIRY